MMVGTELYSIAVGTPVVVLVAPAADVRRVLRWMQIYNPAGNGSIDVTLRYNNGTITGFLTKLTIADGAKVRISGRPEDDLVDVTGIDEVVQVALDDTASTIEATASAVPIAPLQVISSWGDYQ